MALNISFNPIYDFDKGFDFTISGGKCIDKPEVRIMKSKKDKFVTESLVYDENHFVILIMRNTSLQTLPEGWDRSLQDLEDGF